MNRDSVDRWLRSEAESIDKEIEKVETKIKRIMKNEDMNSLDKINQFQIKRRELKAAKIKLYQMLGRIDEVEMVNVKNIENQSEVDNKKMLLEYLKKMKTDIEHKLENEDFSMVQSVVYGYNRKIESIDSVIDYIKEE